MQVNVITGPANEAFNALVYGQPTQDMLNYIDHSMGQVKDKLGDLGTNFMNRANELYNRFSSNEAIMKSKHILNRAGIHVSDDVIYYIPEEKIYNPNIEMQHWIMSEPEIRHMYDRQLCNGYSETYFDYDDHTAKPKERLEYMQVMDGVSTSDPFNKEDTVSFYSYDRDNRREIDNIDRISILDTWRNAKNVLASGFDPTDPDKVEL